jgi:hypothetical protein
MAATLESWQSAADCRLWKIVISPELGERVDLTRLTRDLMERAEKDTEKEWVALSADKERVVAHGQNLEKVIRGAEHAGELDVTQNR